MPDKCILMVTGALFVCGCGGLAAPGTNSTLDNNDASAVLKVTSTASKLAPRGNDWSELDLDGPDVTLDTALIVLDSIKFFEYGGGPNRYDDWTHGSSALVVKGPFLVDLVNETVTFLGDGSAQAESLRGEDDFETNDDGEGDEDDEEGDDEEDDDDGDDEEDDDDDEGSGRKHDRQGLKSGRRGSLAFMELPGGTYHRFKFKLHPLEAEDAPEADHPMIGLSMKVTGSVDGAPFEFCGDFEENLEFRSEEGITVTGDAVANLLMTVDPLSWFVDLADVVATADAELGESAEEPVEPGPCEEEGGCEQWASTVLDFSSQFSSGFWAADQALGEPDTFSYGDSSTAWAAASRNGPAEFITINFDHPVYANALMIREIWGNGFVRRVDALDELGTAQMLWEGEDTSPEGSPYDFLVEFDRTDFMVHGVTIHIDPDHNLATWEEIDAVKLMGSATADVPPTREDTLIICGDENQELVELIRRRMREASRWGLYRQDWFDSSDDTEG